MIVDDDRDICQTLCDILELEGFKVTTAHNGCEALTLLDDRGDFDLILLDVRMPVMDGIETLKKITIDLPVLMISAYGDDTTMRTALAAGAKGYVSKPFEFDQLMTTINRHIG